MRQRDESFAAFALVALAVTVGHIILSVKLGTAYAIPTTLVGALGAAVALRGPLGAALARRIEGAPPNEVPSDAVLGELDDVRVRLGELEERVDFSERLLAQKRETGSAGRGVLGE